MEAVLCRWWGRVGTTRAGAPQLLRGCVAPLLLATVMVAGCGDDEAAVDAAYCDSLIELRTAFEGYSEIEVVQGGLDSIRSYVDDIDGALAEVRSANDARIGEEADEVERKWDELVAAGEIDCPDVAG